MLLPSRLCGLALFAAIATLSSSPHHHAEATHAPVWDPAMATAPVDSAMTNEKGQPGFTLKLYNVRDAMYYSKIRVGSPPQEVRVAFDTAASDLAVLGIKSEGHMSFNHSKSSTYQADGRPVKLRDTSTGILARDRVLLHEGAPVDAQFFTEINNVTVYGPYYKDLRLDGWLGLAPRATQSVGEVPTILQSLFTKHIVEKPIVGISMPKGENGYVSFGQFSSELNDSEMKYIEQPHPGLWTEPISKIDVGDVPIVVPAATFAVLDSLEPFIAGPPRMVEAIAKAVGAKKHPRFDLWIVSCVAPMHNITFWSGEHPITVTVNEMVGMQLSETDCMFMMRSWDDRETPLAEWSLGLPVFHAYFFGFSYDEPRRLGYMPHPK